MKLLQVCLLFFFLSFDIYSQFIKPSRFRLYDEVSTSEFLIWGIGNLGFDSDINFYNPNYFSAKEGLNIFVHGTGGIKSSRDYKFLSEKTTVFSEGNFSMKPNFAVQYLSDNYLFALNYNNTLLFNRSLNNLKFNLSTENGIHSFAANELTISNDALQLSISGKLTEYFSVSIGALTNFFNYSLLISREDLTSKDIENKTKPFSNVQFIAAINHYHAQLFSFYIIFKSQSINQQLDPPQIQLTESAVSQNWAKVNFPAHLGYGFQISALYPFKFSLEMFHKISYEDSTTALNVLNAGFNYDFSNRLLIGLLFTYPVDQDSYVKMNPDGFTAIYDSYIKPRSRYSFMLSSSYSYNRFRFFAGYQYFRRSSAEFKDHSHLASIGIGYEIFR